MVKMNEKGKDNISIPLKQGTMITDLSGQIVPLKGKVFVNILKNMFSEMYANLSAKAQQALLAEYGGKIEVLNEVFDHAFN